MKKLLLLFACVAVLCACGGSSSQSEEKSKPAEESKTLPASSLILKGKHAKLFKLAGPDFKVNLVKVADDWQVRVKMTIATNTPFNQIKDYMKYEREISGPYAKLLNSSDVELENLDMSGKTYEYKRMSYEAAKELFDSTVAVEISGLELEQAKTPSATQSILGDDEDLQDLKDATESAAKLLEAEKELMKALF